MTLVALYVVGIASLWWILRVGKWEGLEAISIVLIPTVLIILFNARAGRMLFKNPIFGVISVLPTAVLIYRASQPLVAGINSWIDRKTNDFVDSQEVVDAEVISKEDA